jgi:hypothetical protein
MDENLVNRCSMLENVIYCFEVTSNSQNTRPCGATLFTKEGKELVFSLFSSTRGLRYSIRHFHQNAEPLQSVSLRFFAGKLKEGV